MSYVILRGRWCDIIILNVHAPREDKIDDIKDRFYEEVEHVFDKFPKYHMKILLGDFNAKVGREDIFKPTIWNESLHEIGNDNGDRAVNFATSKNLTVESTMFPHRNIYKFTRTSSDWKTHNDKSRRFGGSYRLHLRVSYKSVPIQELTTSLCNLLALVHPEDGGDTIHRNVGSYKSHTVSSPRR
jgi:hypothetical protein